MNQTRKKNCIFLCVQNGFAARYILRTDILKKLKQNIGQIVIITPNADEGYILNEFQDGNVSVEQFRTDLCEKYLKKSRGQSFFRKIRSFILNGKYDLRTVDHFYHVYRSEQKSQRSLKMFIIDRLVKILRASRSLRRLLIKVEGNLFCPRLHKDLFEKYKPDLVVTTSLGNMGEGYDFFIMREAKRNNVTTAAIILSWDNTSGKGMAAAVPDHLITWTEIMKEELVEYHDIPSEKIQVGGVAHFDVYYQKEKFTSREEIFKRYNLDPERKLIIFGTKSPASYPWNPDIIEILAKAIQENRFIKPCQILVRVHPIHYGVKNGIRRHQAVLDEYARMRGKYPRVFFNEPPVLSSKLNLDMPASEMLELASILHNTDVLVTMFSTLILEASILDIPVVNVSFEGEERRRVRAARQSIRLEEEHVHNQRIVKTGGMLMAYGPEEMIQHINAYLEYPSLKSENRETIVKQECGPHPGEAGEKIANYLLSCS